MNSPYDNEAFHVELTEEGWDFVDKVERAINCGVSIKEVAALLHCSTAEVFMYLQIAQCTRDALVDIIRD